MRYKNMPADGYITKANIKMKKYLSKLIPFLVLVLVPYAHVYAIPNITFGPLGQGIVDGTSPFGLAQTDASGTPLPCTSSAATLIDGADCGDDNRIIRTQDVATHLWSISVSDGPPSTAPGDPILSDVVIEQIFTPSTNAVLNVKLPAACTTAAGGGTNPPSSVVQNANGSTTLTCNLGPFAEGQARIFGVGVQPSGESWNGSSYSSTQRVYSLDANGNSNSTTNTYVSNEKITISSAPAFDLIHSVSSTQGMYTGYVGSGDVGSGFGTEPGFYAYMNIRVAATRRYGIETVVQPIVFKNILNAKSGSAGGPAFPLEFKITECTPNPSGWGAETWGRENIRTDRIEEEHVVDSGTCSITRDNPSDATSGGHTVTLQDADLSGSRYPTRTIGGTDLTPGPYYVINHRVQIFVPFRSVDLADSVPGNSTGVAYLCSQMNDFDPISPSGTSNFGADVEPGYNGAAMSDGTRSNNIISCSEFKLSVRGNFSKRNLQYSNDAVTSYRYTGIGNYHAGDGELEAGNTHLGWILVYNQGTIGFNNPVACDVFDNTVEQLTDRGNTRGTPGTYAYMGTYAPNGHDPNDYTIEYGNMDFTGDDPLDANHDGTLDYDLATGRYNGDWSKQSAARCDDNATTNGWHTDPNLVTGGIDGVNASRAVLSVAAKAAGKTFGSGQQLRFVVPVMARNTFNGGPYDGQLIPVGTVLPNFGMFRSDEWAPGWTGRSYTPAPENGSVDGDRVTLARIKLALDSHSITPYAASGATASTIAGNQIIWQVDVALQSTLANPGNAQNFQIINVLPPEATYNAPCTASTTGGTPAGTVQYNTDANGNAAPGYTRLIWNLGDYPANTPIPPRIICSDSDPLVQDGTIVTNYAEARADNVISSLAARSDIHKIKLEQVGEIQVNKTVDSPLDDMNDGQIYTLSWANYSAALEIAAPTVIDVFPFNGDNNNPPSSFAGIIELQGPPAVTWSDGSVPVAGDPNPEIGITYYTAETPATISQDPNTNTSNWCTEAQFGSGLPDCPASFADVTSIKFIANYDLAKDGDPRQGMNMVVTLLPGTTSTGGGTTNDPGDIYTNSFSLDSPTLPPGQVLNSGGVSVQIASYSIGDFVFADIDGDGQYDPLIDYTAPKGVVINLHDSGGALVGTTTVGAEKPGRYVFSKLGSGDYYVEIPASEFQSGQLLEHWTSSLLSTSPADDLNETDDQHAYSSGTPLVDGIRTGIMTVSALPPPPGGTPSGNEPLGDNVDLITDPTLDDFSNLTLDMGLKPDVYKVTGTVWNDANNNTLKDSGEVGIAGVTVVLSGSPYPGVPVRCISVDTDANGLYTFDSVMSGNYQLIESAVSSTPFGTATCPPAESDPAGYVSTTANVRNIIVDEANISLQDFGDWEGVLIRGKVFDDNGLSSGLSANGIQDGGERGIGGIKVIATDASGNIYDTTLTATDGSYTLHAPTNATVIKVTEFNGSGYVTTDASVGNSGGTYSAATDTVTFTVVPGIGAYVGLDFGDIKKMDFAPDHQSEVLPGSVVFYAHRFTTTSQGTVKFTTAADANASMGWTHTLYRDVNCDGVLNEAEANTAISGINLGVSAGSQLCLINKVYAPANVAAQDQYRVVTNANFAYGGTGASSLDLKVTDLTIAGSKVTPTTSANPEAGESSLVLRKTVQNLTLNTPEVATANLAGPGDVLKYRIYYRNTGTGAIDDLTVNDLAPEFTTLKAGSAVCDTTATGMTCSPVTGVRAVKWDFTGNLSGGASGAVSYEVVVDN